MIFNREGEEVLELLKEWNRENSRLRNTGHSSDEFNVAGDGSIQRKAGN